jgi:hypothetical protein
MIYFIILIPLYIVNATIIKNINIPSCRNCIHYKPSLYNDFSSTVTKCHYFGTKNIHTDVITYDYADLCRNDENKCGLSGKYFTEYSNIEFKIILHNLIRYSPFGIYFLIFFFLYIKKI